MIATPAEIPDEDPTQRRTTGANCTNPPQGAQFYPIFTTASSLSLTGRENFEGCAWQFGGAFYPGTTHTFGGTSTSEYGTLRSEGS